MNESLNISSTLLNDTIALPRTETNIRIASSTEKVIYILLGCIGIIGNLLVVVAVVSVKSRAKHYADLLIVNQSAIDLLSSVFIIATTLTVDTSSRKLSGFVDELYCRFWVSGYINWSLFLSSTYNLVLLTLERYMAIVGQVLRGRGHCLVHRAGLQHDASCPDVGSQRRHVLQVPLLAESSDGACVRRHCSTRAVLYPTRRTYLRLRSDDRPAAHQSPPTRPHTGGSHCGYLYHRHIWPQSPKRRK